MSSPQPSGTTTHDYEESENLLKRKLEDTIVESEIKKQKNCVFSTVESKDHLTILIMSDIHNYSQYFSNVKQIIEKNQLKIDIVLCPGDIVNIKTKEQYQSKEYQLESLKAVEEMAKQMLNFAPKVYLIPGNHDPDALFKNEFSNGPIEGVTIVHNSMLKLCDGLILAGFGGSIPSFHVSPPEIAGSGAWKGYPFTSDEIFGKELETIISLMKESKEQIVFMTHNGPFACDTTFFKKVNIHSPGITSGSETLRAFIEQDEIQSKCVCHIHGHTHLFRAGSSLVGTLPIVNPGSLMEGNFAVIQLERQNQLENKPFLLESVNLLRFKPTANISDDE